MFNPAWYANSRIGGIALLEFFIFDDSVRRFVPLRTTHLSGSILGPFADFTLTHTFRFSHDQYPHTIEALYRFPLPGDAAVTGVTVTFGQIVITATLKPRVTAEKEYEDAKKSGKAAALLTRESTNVFTLRIAGIAPDEDVMIRTNYVQTGEPEGIGFSYRIPLTTPPRYVRGDEQISRSLQAQPLAVLRDPGYRFSLEITVAGKGTLSSSSHPLIKRDDVYLLARGEVLPDQDCVLNWMPVQEKERPSLQIYSDDTMHPHFLALITPPEQEKRRYPRELIFLVDHSGSMEGLKWTAANRAVENLIRSLHPDDFFNLCLFESNSHWLWKEPLPASHSGIGKAIQFLADRRSGGTELGVALEQALGQLRTEGDISRHVVIITDAQVTDQGRILQLVKTEREQSNKRRVSMLCIDSAPNAALASLIARYGRGIVRFLTSSPDEDDINAALDDLILLWNAPLAIDLTLTVNRDQVVVPERTIVERKEGTSIIDLGDLVPGTSVWIYGKCADGPSPCTFMLSGSGGSIRADADGKHPPVRFLYGANVVASLDFLMNSAVSSGEITEELKILGYELPRGSQARKPVYHENVVKESREAIKDLLIQESLAYGIPSSETAFISVRRDADRVVEESVIVANALPVGWSDNFVRSSGPMSMIMQPDGTLKTNNRKARDLASGGALLEWGGCGAGYRHSIPKDTVKPIKSEGDAYILPPKGTSGPSLITITLFKGRPLFSHGEAVLFDSDRKGMQNVIPRGFHIKKLIFSCTESRPEFMYLRLMLFISDMVRHVIEIPLSELEARGGEIEVYATRKHAAVIRLLLMDLSETHTLSLPEMTVSVEGEVV